MWVAGDDLPGGGGVEVVANPATEELLAEVPSASPDQVDPGRRGGQGRPFPAGAGPRPGDRGELLHGVAAWLREHTDELGRLMTLEGGRPLATLRLAEALADRPDGVVNLVTGGAGSWPRRSWWAWTTPWTCSPPRPSVRSRPCAAWRSWRRARSGSTTRLERTMTRARSAA
jgi:acyl-CoA reductase-like NAD-dependent aldehyde dehydrogenase